MALPATAESLALIDRHEHLFWTKRKHVKALKILILLEWRLNATPSGEERQVLDSYLERHYALTARRG